jgi:hypothetical protein
LAEARFTAALAGRERFTGCREIFERDLTMAP